MKEDFLHYVWRYKKFDMLNLRSTSGEPITILSVGQYLQQAGPDFFDARIVIDDQKWAGNVEIHLKSSDWYIHHHESDRAYDTVILHVVWEHDTDVFRQDNCRVTTLELKHYVDPEFVQKYAKLTTPKSWIYCERELASVTSFTISNFKEQLFIERLISRAVAIEALAMEWVYDWEAVLFYLLAKNFGLNTNGEVFFAMSKRLSFNVVRRECQELENLEALFFGVTGLLSNCDDVYQSNLSNRYLFLRSKYAIDDSYLGTLQFFEHRPDNFPTIRLAQLAALYHRQHNLFDDIIISEVPESFYGIFSISVSEYWNSHYQFGKVSRTVRKPLSRSFIQLLIINTIVPLKFAYHKHLGTDVSQQLIELLEFLPCESNSVIERFCSFGLSAENAFDSQALLQLKNEYCNKVRCMQCSIGTELMQQPEPKIM